MNSEYQYAIDKGWLVELAECDVRNNRTLENNHDVPSFSKSNKVIWYCGQSYPDLKFWWQCRDRDSTTLVLKPYETRREYNTLTEAINSES